MDDKQYMLTLTALIGNTKAKGELHHPVQLLCHAVVTAENEEGARTQFTGFKEPGFKLEITNVTELGSQITPEDLQEIMGISKVIEVIKI